MRHSRPFLYREGLALPAVCESGESQYVISRVGGVAASWLEVTSGGRGLVASRWLTFSLVPEEDMLEVHGPMKERMFCEGIACLKCLFRRGGGQILKRKDEKAGKFHLHSTIAERHEA